MPAVESNSKEEAADTALVQRWTESLNREIWAYRDHRRRRWLRAATYLLAGAIGSVVAMLFSGNFGIGMVQWWFIPVIFIALAARDAAAGSRRVVASQVAKAADPR